MTRYERWIVWSSALATGITGVGFFWTKYLVEAPEPWAVVNHPLEPWLLKLHIVAAPVFVFAVGMIATRHILVHIRSRVRQGRRSGLALVGLLLPMAGTGYLIQVVSLEAWIVPLAVVHIVTGAVFLLAIGAHWLGIASADVPGME